MEIKVLPAIILSLGLTMAGFVPGYYYYQAHFNNRYVTVKGLAEQEVKADLAVWDIKFQTTGNDLKQTQQKLSNDATKIQAYLTQKGFEASEILIGRINTNDLMANPYRDNIKGSRYILSQTITVRSQKVDTVEQSLRQIGSLVAQGVLFDNQEYSSPVSYLFTGLNQIKPSMLQKATQNARQAANEFAKSSQAHLGQIKRANQGVFSILPREQTPGSSESQQINKTVRVVSTVEYYLN